MEGEKHFADWVKIATLLLFASVLYFGKNAPITPVSVDLRFLTDTLIVARSILRRND